MNPRRSAAIALSAVLLSAAAAPVPAPAAPDLSDFSERGRLLIGTLPVRVTPRSETVFTAPVTGKLTLFVEPVTQELPEGAPIAAVDLEKIALEQEVLDLSQTILDEKEVREWRVQNEQAIARLENEQAKTRSEKALLEKLLQNPEFSETFLPGDSLPPDLGDDASEPAVRALLARADERIALLRDFLEFIRSERHGDLELKLRRVKLEQQRLALKERVQAARITMPFDGQVQFLQPFVAGQREAQVKGGTELVQVRDLSEVLAQAAIKLPAWRLLEPSRTSVQIGRPEDGLVAAFRSSEVQVVAGREELVYTFAFPKRATSRARPLLGGAVTGQLYYDLGGTFPVAPKLTLILADPATFRRSGWPGLVDHLFPGHRPLCLGQDAVAIAPVGGGN